MKIRVSKVKEDKGELRGLLLSFLLLLAAVAAFGTGSLGFLNRTGERSQETLRKAIARGCVQCYAIEGSITERSTRPTDTASTATIVGSNLAIILSMAVSAISS